MAKRAWGLGRTEQLNVRVSPEEKQHLQVLAGRLGMTPHEYIRQMLDNNFTLAGIK